MSTYRLLSLAAFVLASGTEDDQVVQFRKAIGRLQKVFMENRHALSLAEVALKNLNSSTNASSISSRMDAQDHLSVGQRVRCRDVKVETIWKSGIVTATSPAECKPDGWSSGYVFTEIEAFKKATSPRRQVARMALTSSSALQLVANVDDDGEDDRLERLGRTHRNDENYDTVAPWQECDITVRTEGIVDPLKTVDKLKECTEKLRKEVKDTVDAHQSSKRANSHYIGKFKEAIQLLQKLSDVQTMRVAFAADHAKVRSYLEHKADTLVSGVDKLAE